MEKIFYRGEDNQFHELQLGNSLLGRYSSVEELPTKGNAGDFAIVGDLNTLYMYVDDNWIVAGSAIRISTQPEIDAAKSHIVWDG